MKRFNSLVLIPFLIIISVTSSVSQNEYFPDQSIWGTGWSSIAGPQAPYFDQLCGDTLIDNTLYKRLYRY